MLGTCEKESFMKSCWAPIIQMFIRKLIDFQNQVMIAFRRNQLSEITNI